jgi:hypothetical protein
LTARTRRRRPTAVPRARAGVELSTPATTALRRGHSAAAAVERTISIFGHS